MRLLLFIKISVMLLILVAVFYSMRYLRSSEFMAKVQSPDSPLAVLLGTNDVKPANWCPNPLQSLQLFIPGKGVAGIRTLTTVADWAALCEVLMEPAAKADLEDSYENVVIAFPESGEPVALERNSKGVFRALGTSFRSQGLEKALKRYEN